MLNNCPNSMCVDNTNINEISNIIASLKSGNSQVSDGVSSALINIFQQKLLFPSLQYSINQLPMVNFQTV